MAKKIIRKHRNNYHVLPWKDNIALINSIDGDIFSGELGEVLEEVIFNCVGHHRPQILQVCHKIYSQFEFYPYIK